MWRYIVSGAVPTQLSPLSDEKYDEELDMAKSLGEAQTSIELKTQPADKNTQLRVVKPGLRGGAPPMHAMRRSLSDNSIDEGDSVQKARALLREKARELEEMWAHRSKRCPPLPSTDLPTTSLPTTRITLEKGEESFLPTTEVSTLKGESKLSDFDQFGLATQSFEKTESTASVPMLYERTFAQERLYEPPPSYQSDITSSEGGARKEVKSGFDSGEGDPSFLPQQIPTEFKFPLRIRSISPYKHVLGSPPLTVPALDTPSEFDDEHILPSVHQSRPQERQSRRASEKEIKKKMADVIYKMKMMRAQEGNSEIKKTQQDDWLSRTNLRGNLINLGEDVSSYTLSDRDFHQPWGHRRSISEVRDQREIDMLNEKAYLLKRLKEINDSLKTLHLEELSDPMISQEAEWQARLAEEANLQQQWEDISRRYQRYPLRKEERDSPKLKRSFSGEPLARKSNQGIQLEITADTLRDEWKKFAQQQALQKQAQQKHALQQVLQQHALEEQVLQQALQQQAFQEQAVKQQIQLPQDLQSVCNLLRQELTTIVKREIPKRVSEIAKVEIKKIATGLLQNVSPRMRDSAAESTDGADWSVSMKVQARTQGSLTGDDSERPLSASDMASVSEWGSENRNISAQGDWDYNKETKKLDPVTKPGYSGDMGVTDTQMEYDSHKIRSAEGAIPKRGARRRILPSITSDSSTVPSRRDSNITLKSAESYISKISDDIFESTVESTAEGTDEEEKSEIETIFEDCTTTSVVMGDYSSSPSPTATARSETEDDSNVEKPLKLKQQHHKRESHHKKRTPSPSESSYSELLVRPKTPPKSKHETRGERHGRRSSHDPRKHSADTYDVKTKKEKSKRHSEKIVHHKESRWSPAESTAESIKDTRKPQKLRHARKISFEEHKDLSPRSDTVDTEDLQKSARKESKHSSPKSKKEQVKSHRKRSTYGDPMDVTIATDAEGIDESSYAESKKRDTTQISPKRGQIWTHIPPYPREQEKVPGGQERAFSQVQPDSKITTHLQSAIPSIITEDLPNEGEIGGESSYQYIEQPVEVWDEQLKKWKVIPRGQIRTREPSVVSIISRDDPKVSPQISGKSPQWLQVQQQQTQHKRGLQKVTQEPIHIQTSGSPLRQHFAEPSTSAKPQGKKGLKLVLQKPIEIELAPSPGYTEEGTSDILMLDTIEAKKLKEIAVEVRRDPRLTHAYMYKGGSPNLSVASVPEKDPKLEEYYLKQIDKLSADVAKTSRMILKLNPQISAKEIYDLTTSKKITSGMQLVEVVIKVFPPGIHLGPLRLAHELLFAPKERAVQIERVISKAQARQQQSFHKKVVEKLEACESSGTSQKSEKTHERYVGQLMPPHLAPLRYGGSDDQEDVVLWKPKKKKSPSP